MPEAWDLVRLGDAADAEASEADQPREAYRGFLRRVLSGVFQGDFEDRLYLGSDDHKPRDREFVFRVVAPAWRTRPEIFELHRESHQDAGRHRDELQPLWEYLASKSHLYPDNALDVAADLHVRLDDLWKLAARHQFQLYGAFRDPRKVWRPGRPSYKPLSLRILRERAQRGACARRRRDEAKAIREEIRKKYRHLSGHIAMRTVEGHIREEFDRLPDSARGTK